MRENRAQQAVVQRVAGLVGRKGAEQRSAEKIEIADRVEQLVPDEFVGEAQAFGVEHAVFIEHHGVVEAAAERKAAVAQVFHLVHEAEGARPGDLFQVGSLREVHLHGLGRAFDHRMAEIDRERKLVAFERLEARPFIGVPDLHPPNDAQEAFRRRLLDDPRLLDEQYEGRRAAVHDGKLGGVEIHVNVVHAESAKRGHQMLHRVDLHPIAH